MSELDKKAAEAAREREGTRLLHIKDCPTCKTNKHVKVNAEYVGYSIYCDNCYDCDCVGDPPRFVSLAPTYTGDTKLEAINEWNENIDED